MKWPWRKSRPEPGPTPADEALQRSREQLEAVRRASEDRRRRFEELAEVFRRTREENHLAEKFRDAIEEGRWPRQSP